MKKVFVLTITSLLLSSFLFSQKKYPSLLWEISGNGLKEKSYLYGTMHVSEKIAFNLSDIFFEKLYSVKQVALESDPNLWLDEVKSTENSYRYDSYSLYNDYNNNKYTSFYLSPVETKFYRDALRVNDYVTDGILYRRYGGGTQNFQENTYLDMFIYRSAKKLNKKFCGLEDIKESREIMDKSYQYDSYDSYSNAPKPWLKKILKGRPIRMVMEEAYRKQDLDLIDSLQKGAYSPENLKYTLYIRNGNMVKSMDSLMKRGSLFSAVGAAHLAGKKGIIEQLRAKGYKVEPLTSAYTEKGKKLKENIDNLISSQPLNTQNGYDGFSINAPNKFFSFSERQIDYLISLDIPNGAFLSVSKFSHFNYLNKKSQQSPLQSIDSLLYENIPGKILLKKQINRNGYPGIEVTSKNDADEYLETQIYFTPLETYIFNLNGTKNYDTKYKNAVFSSLKLKTPSNSFSNYTPKYGGYTVNLPDYRIISDSLTSSPNVTAYDKNSDSYYFINTQIMDMISPEKEKYELERIPYEFGKNIDSKEIETVIIDDTIPYSESNISLNDKKKLYLKTIINGASYNLVGIITQNEAVKKRFFDSFKLKDFSAYKKPEKYENKKAGYSVNLPFKPAENKKRSWEEPEISKTPVDSATTAIDNAYIPYDYSFDDSSASYKLENGQRVSISYSSPYLESDSLETEQIIKNYIKDRYQSDSCTVNKIRFVRTGTSVNGYSFSDYMLENENSAQTYKQRYYYQNGKIYQITYLENKHQEYNNPSANEIFDNIVFIQPEIKETEEESGEEIAGTEGEIEENNTIAVKPDDSTISDSENKGIEEPETIVAGESDYYADGYKIEQDSLIWTAVDKKNQPLLNKMKSISTDHKKIEDFMLSCSPESLNREILNAFIQVLDFYNQTKSDFYEKLYPKFTNKGDSQLAILGKIIQTDSVKGLKKVLPLMEKDLPIPASQSEIYSFFDNCSYYADKSENYLLPGILKYLTVSDYTDPIMDYLSQVGDKLKPKHIKKYKQYFLNEARNDFKRMMAAPDSSNSDSDYYSDYSTTDPLTTTSDFKKNLDMLSIIDDSNYQQLVAQIRNSQKPELIALLPELKKPVSLTQNEYLSLAKETIPSKELNKTYKEKFGKDMFDPEQDLTADLAKSTLLKNSKDQYYDYSSVSAEDSLTLKEEKIINSDTKRYKVFYFTVIKKNTDSQDLYSSSKKNKEKENSEEEKEYNGTYLAVIAFDLTQDKEDNENSCYNASDTSYNDYSYDQPYYDESSMVKIAYMSTDLSYYDEEDWKELDESFIDYLQNKEHPRATSKFNKYDNDYYGFLF